MSYILDALRRAESERERGEVPGLHAQAEPVGLGEGTPAKAASVGWMALGGAAFAAALVFVGWWIARPPGAAAGTPAAVATPGSEAQVPAASEAAQAGMAPPTAAASAGPPLLVAPPVPPAPAAPPPRPAGEPARAAAEPARSTPTSRREASATDVAPRGDEVTAAAPPPSPPRPAGANTAPNVATTTGMTTSSGAAPATGARPGAAPATGAGPGAAPDSSARPGAAPDSGARPAAGSPTPLADLPPAQRAELPQLLIGGAIYSDQPASRFVVINGLVVREGETAAPGVVLERIAPKSAVIRWREMRIELPI